MDLAPMAAPNPSTPHVERVPIANLVLDPELQPRAVLDTAIVQQYADLIAACDTFPPVTAFEIDGRLLLTDGFHRFAARRFLAQDHVQVSIRQGTRWEAIRYSREFNVRHGLRLSRGDIRRAIVLYLQSGETGIVPGASDREAVGWSDRRIATLLGCDHKTVGAVRRGLARATELPEAEAIRRREKRATEAEKQRNAGKREVIRWLDRNALHDFDGTLIAINDWWRERDPDHGEVHFLRTGDYINHPFRKRLPVVSGGRWKRASTVAQQFDLLADVAHLYLRELRAAAVNGGVSQAQMEEWLLALLELAERRPWIEPGIPLLEDRPIHPLGLRPRRAA
jgi:hypothetical protein